MSTDPRHDAYIADAAPFAQPILNHLRAVIHGAVPDVEETIKWSMPFFTFQGKILCNLAAFKAHCSFGILGPEARAEVAKDGYGSEEGMGTFGKLTSVKDLPAKSKLAGYLKRSAARIAAGKSPMAQAAARRKPRQPIPLPPEFTTALGRSAPAKVNFAKLPPSHQREYLEWITEAKREETRARRIAQSVEWISEGKSRNWKYAEC
jgi:uncharacterized protein YdeI (YjbR/CyaY-like superfamily)